MTTTAIVTMVKMLESLPEPLQDRAVEHLREYLAELADEIEWNRTFQQTQPQLAQMAQQARLAIREGKAQPFESDRL